MAKAKRIYNEFNALVVESHTWTPRNHKVDRMKELFDQMPAPGVSYYTHIRWIEKKLGLPPTTASEVVHRFNGRDARFIREAAAEEQAELKRQERQAEFERQRQLKRESSPAD